MPFYLPIIAESIDQLHILEEFSDYDDRFGDVFNFIEFQIKGQIETQVTRFLFENTHTDFFFDCTHSVLVQVEESHTKRSSTETS